MVSIPFGVHSLGFFISFLFWDRGGGGLHMPRGAGWLVGWSVMGIVKYNGKAIRRRSRYLEIVFIFSLFSVIIV